LRELKSIRWDLSADLIIFPLKRKSLAKILQAQELEVGHTLFLCLKVTPGNTALGELQHTNLAAAVQKLGFSDIRRRT